MNIPHFRNLTQTETCLNNSTSCYFYERFFMSPFRSQTHQNHRHTITKSFTISHSHIIKLSPLFLSTPPRSTADTQHLTLAIPLSPSPHTIRAPSSQHLAERAPRLPQSRRIPRSSRAVGGCDGLF